MERVRDDLGLSCHFSLDGLRHRVGPAINRVGNGMSHDKRTAEVSCEVRSRTIIAAHLLRSSLLAFPFKPIGWAPRHHASHEEACPLYCPFRHVAYRPTHAVGPYGEGHKASHGTN